MPTTSRNLISVSCLAQESYVISFHKDHCNIFYKKNKVTDGFLINGLYRLHIDVSVFNIKQNVNAIGIKRPRDSLNDRYLWHLRLGHIAKDRVNKLEKFELLSLKEEKHFLRVGSSRFHQIWDEIILKKNYHT